MKFSKEWMQARAAARDTRCDGWFLVEKESLGTYCLASCITAIPEAASYVLAEHIEKSREKGLKACRECRPNRFLKTFEKKEVTARKIKARIAELSCEPEGKAKLTECLQDIDSAFREICRQYFHLEPEDLWLRLKVTAFAARLRSMSAPEDIQAASDQMRHSQFSAIFQAHMGLSSEAYAALGSLEDYVITLPRGFRQDLIEPYWLRDEENLIFQRRGEWFWRSFQVGKATCLLRARFKGSGFEIVFEEKTLNLDGFLLHEQLRRMLGLDCPPQAFEAQMKASGHQRLIGNRQGLRVVRTPTIYEALVWTILGQQINLAFAYTLRNRLIRFAGRPLSHGHFAHPTPQAVAQLDPELLRQHQFSKAKAHYLVDLSKRIVNGDLELESLPGEPVSYIERILMAERGIGLWTARYVTMRGCGYADCVPVGDAGLKRSLQTYYALDSAPNPSETEDLMALFTPYRSLATFHFWALLA